MIIRGKIFKFDDMPYKVIAYNGNIAVIENMTENSDLKGDVEFLISPHINMKDGVIRCSRVYSFGLTKEDYYNKIKEKMNGCTIKSGLFGLRKKRLEPVDVNNLRNMVNALHKDYYKIPTKYLELIVTAYQDNM